MIWLRAPFTLGALVVIAGCGGGDSPDPASLPRDEAQALNDAASMLNSREDTPPQIGEKRTAPIEKGPRRKAPALFVFA